MHLEECGERIAVEPQHQLPSGNKRGKCSDRDGREHARATQDTHIRLEHHVEIGKQPDTGSHGRTAAWCKCPYADKAYSKPATIGESIKP